MRGVFLCISTFLPIIPSKTFRTTFAFECSCPFSQCKVIYSLCYFTTTITPTFFNFFLIIFAHISLFKLILKYKNNKVRILIFFKLYLRKIYCEFQIKPESQLLRNALQYGMSNMNPYPSARIVSNHIP